MSYVACIKDKNNMFEIESATWFVNCPALCITVNKPAGISLVDMVDRLVDHTLYVFDINKSNVRRFCANTGLCRSIYIRITFKRLDIKSNTEDYWLSLYYVVFMIAYAIDSEMKITKEELDMLNKVNNKLNNGDLLLQ